MSSVPVDELLTFTLNVGDQSHNDVSQLQTDKSPEFLSAGDISRMPSEFDIFNEPPEVTSANGDNLQMQANFDESLDLASVFDAQQFQNGFKLTELTNADGHQYEIYPEYVNSVYKSTIHQVSQVHQQLSRLDSILSENKVMQSQMSSSLNDHLNNLYTTLDSYSSYFNQLLGKLLIEPTIKQSGLA
ncbi:44189_t:CDS:2 [Gigaspora margarita]|uniref:44189_t:CDS:1 n=1 Tax=Gigaspora margarita TaxID=4874 RepID=A0ABN7UKT3_GIGMA|nr:44189_t:CDS:2 [Gigaspora margarita]